MRVSIIKNELKLGGKFMCSFIFNLSSVNYGLFVLSVKLIAIMATVESMIWS